MVYIQEAVIPLQFKHRALEIDKVLKLDIDKAKEERIFHLQKIEEK